MRKILLWPLIFLSVVLHAQNYNPIFLNGSVHFESEQGYMVPYRIDSTFQHNDTTDYYSFHMIRPIGGDGLCTLKGGSWIGKKIEKCPNGEWKFYNCSDIPILLKQNAEPGQNWIFYQLDDGSYFQAHVNDVVNKLVLGQMDSVKQICIQYFNSEGNPTDHFINDDTLELSKNFGLVSIFDFFYFPYQVDSYYDELENYISLVMRLVGIDELNIGYKNITAQEVFTFEREDEIHSFFSTQAPCTKIEYLNINKIQNAIINLPLLEYEQEYCAQKRIYNSQGTEIVKIDTFHIFRNVSYNIDEYNFINPLALEPISEYSDYYNFFKASGISKYISNSIIYYSDGTDTLYKCLVDGYNSTIYYRGLGCPFNSFFPFDGCGNSEDLKYYKKADSEWGIPYHCPTLLPIDETSKNKINVYPNPVNEAFKIEGLDKAARIEIFNMQGQKMQDFEILPGREINAAGLNSGMYLIKLHVNNKTVCKRIWKN